MSFLSRRCTLAACVLVLFACGSSSSSSNGGSNASGSGGCGGGVSTNASDGPGDVRDAPTKGPSDGAPGTAPTGQTYKAEEDDLGCGRSGLRWVLVDEVCGDGEGADPRSLETPMFRDGALVGSHLLAVDATHLWSLDVTNPAAPSRSALITGLGQPLSVQGRASRVYIASGSDGLVVVNAADPSRPARESSLLLPGPAFDVDLRGTNAYVAVGHSGVASVDISGFAPSLVTTHSVPGHAAGLASDERHLFVAACTSFSVLDRATGDLLSNVPFPKAGARLLAPAKDVALVGTVAFVAAGKQGAVAIDIATPTAPKVLGRCTVHEPSFYASGVRAQGNTVFVAGGEWGVLSIDATNARTACTEALETSPPEKPALECSKEPPWRVVPWDKVWAPPPPGRDPIQVLPSGDRLYAFGDARRIGVRAVDVRASTDLAKVGRYDEPRTLLGIAAHGSRVFAAGPRGGVFNVDDKGALSRVPTEDDAALLRASFVTTLADGRFVALDGGKVHVEGLAEPIEASAHAIATQGQEIVVADTFRISTYGADGTLYGSASLGGTAYLPLSLAAGPEGAFYAAPEWPTAFRQALNNARQVDSMDRHEVFNAEEILDVDRWRERVPRRHLAVTPRGLVELAALGSRAGIAVHGAAKGSVTARVALPALTYAGLAADDDHAYAVAVDRGLYKSYLVTVSLAAEPRVVSVEAFTGAASGVAVSADRVFVADADGAVRIYAVHGNDVTPLAVAQVEARP